MCKGLTWTSGNSLSVIWSFLSSVHRASISRDPFYDMLATRKRRIANKKWWPSTFQPHLHHHHHVCDRQSPRVCVCVWVCMLRRPPICSFRAGGQAADTRGFLLFPPEDRLYVNSLSMWRFYLIRHRLWTLMCHLRTVCKTFTKLDANKWTKRTRTVVFWRNSHDWTHGRSVHSVAVTRLPSAGHMRN